MIFFKKDKMENIQIAAAQSAQKLIRFIQEDDIDAAESELNKFHDEFGDCYYTSYLSANLNASLDNWVEARDDAINALQYNVSDGEMWNTLGVALCNCSEYEEGLNALYKAREIGQYGASENIKYWESIFLTIKTATNLLLNLWLENYDDEDYDSMVRITDLNEILSEKGHSTISWSQDNFNGPMLVTYIQKEMPALNLSIIEVPGDGIADIFSVKVFLIEARMSVLKSIKKI